jgi:hypothetical protein
MNTKTLVALMAAGTIASACSQKPQASTDAAYILNNGMKVAGEEYEPWLENYIRIKGIGGVELLASVHSGTDAPGNTHDLGGFGGPAKRTVNLSKRFTITEDGKKVEYLIMVKDVLDNNFDGTPSYDAGTVVETAGGKEKTAEMAPLERSATAKDLMAEIKVYLDARNQRAYDAQQALKNEALEESRRIKEAAGIRPVPKNHPAGQRNYQKRK